MNPARRWRAVKERLRFRYFPRIVDWLIHLSTYQARLTLQKTGPITILVDNTVLGHGITHETAWVSTGTKKWGRLDVDTGYAARIPVHSIEDESATYNDVKFLPGIASLARRGSIILRTSAELSNERFSQPSGRFSGYGWFDYNIFGKIRMESVDGLAFPTMGPSYLNLPNAVQQQRSRLDRSQAVLYRALVDRLGPKNSQDAWHIRTAEIYGLFCFLTMDFKLIRNVRARSGQEPLKSLHTKVMTPSELGKYLRLVPISPRVLSYHDASFFVRSDLNWPESQRRPLKSYRKDKP
jgi:hypothetical protein